jgi:hypothetical protein
MALWMGLLTHRAWTELTVGTTVQGMHRQYHPPFQHPLGWVVDPRSRSLLDEVMIRYRQGASGVGQRLSSDDWGPTLSHLGIANEEVSGRPWNRGDPRLRMGSTAKSHHLLMGVFGVQYLVFYPDVGVVLTEALPPAVREWRLLGAVEAPW